MQSGGLTDLIAEAFGPGAAVLAIMFIAAIVYLVAQARAEKAAREEEAEKFRKVIASKDKQLREAARARGELQRESLNTLNDLGNFLERIVRGIDRQDSEFNEHDRDVKNELSKMRERLEQLANTIREKNAA